MLLEIVSPEGHLFNGEVTSVTVPGTNGEFQLLNHHANIVSILTEGTVKVEAVNLDSVAEYSPKFIRNGREQKLQLAIQSGTLEMKDNKIIILVD